MDWYPWFFQLYKADTMHLDPYQDGCYRRLIDHYMETRQPLPDNDYALARIVGDSHPNWVAMASAIVRPFFISKNGLLYHKKCDEVLADQDRRTRNLSESGKAGAKKRWNNNKDIDSPPIATPLATPLGSAIAQDRTRQDKEKDITKVISKKEKIGVENLRIEDVQDWLTQKRVSGKYLLIDEYGLLEMFKDYCRSKNPKYTDYVAAFRNSFNWKNAPTTGNQNGKQGKYTADDALRDALAEIEQGYANSPLHPPMLCLDG